MKGIPAGTEQFQNQDSGLSFLFGAAVERVCASFLRALQKINTPLCFRVYFVWKIHVARLFLSLSSPNTGHPLPSAVAFF